jgi:hypothetical protein
VKERLLAVPALLVSGIFGFVGARFWTARQQHLALLAGRRTSTTINMIPLRELEALAVVIGVVLALLVLHARRGPAARVAVAAVLIGLVVSVIGFQRTPARFFSGPLRGQFVSLSRYPHLLGVAATLSWAASAVVLLAAVLLASRQQQTKVGAATQDGADGR